MKFNGVNLLTSAEALGVKLAEYLPNIFGTLILIIVGFFLAKVIGKMVSSGLAAMGVDKTSTKLELDGYLTGLGVKSTLSELFGKVVFWLIMLTFIISASEALNLERITSTIDVFVLYLPNIIAAGFILILGLMASRFIKSLVLTSVEKLELSYGASIGNFVYSIAILIVLSLTVDQLQLETDLLNNILLILLFSSGIGFAIAFGLGGKTYAERVMSGITIGSSLKEGSKIEFKGNKYEVVTLKLGVVVLKMDDGSINIIPNNELSNTSYKIV